MTREVEEKEFATRIISAGRVTVPSYILSGLDLEEGTRVQVKISQAQYKVCIIYKDKETDKIEMVATVINSPSVSDIAKKGRKILDGKSVEWAYFFHPNWVIEPETIKIAK